MDEPPCTALRRARLEAGLTLRQLAAEMHISHAHLSDMERGWRAIRDEMAWLMPEPIGREVRKALANRYRQMAQDLEHRDRHPLA